MQVAGRLKAQPATDEARCVFSSLTLMSELTFLASLALRSRKKATLWRVKVIETGCLLSKVNQLPQPISFFCLRSNSTPSLPAKPGICHAAPEPPSKNTHSPTFHLLIQDVFRNLLASNVIFFYLFVFNTYFTASVGAV